MVKKNKILVIVESPGKVKTISKYLGSDYIVRASFGHIFDLVTKGVGNFGVDIEKGFIPKYQVSPDKKDKIKAILSAAKSVDEVYIAADADREGEAIAWHLAEVLKPTKKPIKRVIFNEITKKAIQSAIKKLGDLNKDLYDAQQARRVIDRIVGFSVSPVLINKFGPKLSAGRVQSVAVRIVVDREREIEAFKPEEYWNITVALAKPKLLKDNFIAKYAKKVSNKKTALSIKKDLDSDSYTISNLEEKEKKRNPYPPLITSTMCSLAAGRYRFATARTMQAAQKLYEAGHITYLRTDSVRSSPDSIQSCREWLDNNGHELPAKPNFYGKSKKGKNVQDAHEAIRPTNVELTPQNIHTTNDEQKVYRLIWETFVASQMKPALYNSVSVTVESSSGHILKTNGRTLKYKGWLEIAKDYEKDKNADAKLPALKQNDNLVLVPPKVKAEQKFTQPPSRYSEQTLIKELEKQGIGRPSTYASIMSKITSRKYVEKKSSSFVATDLGKKIVDDLVKHFSFMKVSYTSNLEDTLDKISEGNAKYKKTLEDFYKPFVSELKKSVLSEHEDFGFECPKCGGPMILKHGKFGFYLACYDYPKKCKRGTLSCEVVNGKPILKSKDYTPEVVEGVFCPKCKAAMVKRDGKFGPFYACSKYPKCKGTRKVPYGKKCPDCGNELYATIWKNKNVLFCMGYPECKHSEKMPKGNLANPSEVCKEPKVAKKIKRIIKKV